VSTTAATFQRARRPEQKQQRRDAILDAARQLARRDGVRSVRLSDIAAQVGIHKSALLRYFETREQIFLELTAQSWREWGDGLHTELDAASVATADLVADALARSFAERPLLCDLIAHTALNLERNVSPEAVRRYKRTSLGAIERAAGAVHEALPELYVYECRELVSTIATLTGTLWQIANPPAALAELYASDPQLARACVELTPRLRRIATILLAGLIPTRPPTLRPGVDSAGGGCDGMQV
jgi:AcrR family transcriptional regulator